MDVVGGHQRASLASGTNIWKLFSFYGSSIGSVLGRDALVQSRATRGQTPRYRSDQHGFCRVFRSFNLGRDVRVAA
jgi:hypothetical protein